MTAGGRDDSRGGQMTGGGEMTAGHENILGGSEITLKNTEREKIILSDCTNIVNSILRLL